MWSDANQLWGAGQDGNLEAGELDDLLLDAQSEPEQTLGEHRSRLRASNKASREEEEPPTKKRKTSKTKSVKAAPPVFDLVEPEFPASQSTRSSRRASQEDDSQNMFGELSSLDHADAIDKTARKKSLRFHTSKIESATARRQGARSRALGGDDDIPYKERRKEKNARLEAQADKGLRGQGGADLDDAEPSPRDADVDMEDADGYYELVKKTSKAKKELKKAEHDASAAAARAHVEENGVDGPRSLTRAILSNKGLTPHRPKSVRNPRVKKRQKFEKAKRKVASQKAVYKGGLNATGGRYDGEKTGISKVVKSIRLS
ncbi:hypothetical protein ONZ45_g18602 [Pleurotus djamor]|nr:hypothetical protein ONZ45_g18602 [Pleurotus djamor]